MAPGTEFLRSIENLPAADRVRVQAALARAEACHQGQQRESGEPYVVHPIAVAQYLLDLQADADTLMAALLHDVVEDGRTTLDDIRGEFGPVVARLVDGVTKLSKLRYEGRHAERQVASLRKMLLVASEDLRVVYIKLADRWHNIHTVDALRPDKRTRVAYETLDIYVPFARLLGLWELKRELENVCFPIAFPAESDTWHAAIARMRERLKKEREEFIHSVDAETDKDIRATLEQMTDYELFTKLQGNLARLQQTSILDSALLCIMRPDATPIDCYKLLGEIHQRYAVPIGTFRDYISVAQPNGYRALHTTIFLSRDHQCKLRIQTQAMRDHVLRRKLSSLTEQSDIYSALNSLHATSFQQDRYIQDLKQTLLTERINVFTTSGEIFTLPRDATGVDFAFALNPDHVAYLAGIRVNGEVCEATHRLKEGDVVELVLLQTGPNEMRSGWIDKVKSVDAREGIKRSLRRSPRIIRIAEGKSILTQECQKRRLPTKQLFGGFGILRRALAGEMGQGTFDDVLEAIGSGAIPVNTVVDAYRRLLTTHAKFRIRLLQLFRLLPHSRVLNKDASIMDLVIDAHDRKGLIHDITRCFAERDINITSFQVFATPDGGALYKIRIEVENFDEFSDLFDALSAVPSVKTVLRTR